MRLPGRPELTARGWFDQCLDLIVRLGAGADTAVQGSSASGTLGCLADGQPSARAIEREVDGQCQTFGTA